MLNLSENKYKFLITGGTGFIGRRLCDELLKSNQKITILSRKVPAKNDEKISYIADLDEKKFDYDIVINLCGEPISQRWSKGKKAEIYQSRIGFTKNLVRKINGAENPPSLLISGSAIGYYGTAKNTIFQESSQPTKQNLFSQNLCFDWESAAKEAQKKTRVILLRTGVVIGQNGGMIKKMTLPFKLGLGGKISSGQQHLSWIHLDDAVAAIIHLINKNNISGAVNLTSPNSATNEEFSHAFAKALNRPCLFTIPAISMKLLYGKMAQELLLTGQKVYPRILLDSGFDFKFKIIEEALQIEDL
jgi:uncharacterized protein (TIGR01777 family)